MSDDITVRDFIAGYLTPLMPDNWLIVPTVEPPAVLTKPTVTITHHLITPDSQSAGGLSVLSNEVIVRITSEKKDFEVAENNLDDAVLGLMHALGKSDRISLVRAEKKTIENTPYLCWEVTLKVLSQDTITD